MLPDYGPERTLGDSGSPLWTLLTSGINWREAVSFVTNPSAPAIRLRRGLLNWQAKGWELAPPVNPCGFRAF